MKHVDHLIFGTPDLELGVSRLERLLGVRASTGGRHPVWGTHNALLALGPDCYLEVMAPDPGLPRPESPRLFGLDDLAEPRLLTWAARADDLERTAQQAARAGVSLGAASDGGRQRPDGTWVRWRITDPFAPRLGGVVPFLIDWGATPHPAGGAAPGCTLRGLRAEHPDPDRVRAALGAMEVTLAVEPGARPALVATIEGALGQVELR